MAHPSRFPTMKAARSLIGQTAHFYGASRQHPETENGAVFYWSRGKSLCLIVDSILIVVDRSDGEEDKGGEYLKISPLGSLLSGRIPLVGGRHNNPPFFWRASALSFITLQKTPIRQQSSTYP
jgi:hypothetical protein